MKRLHALVCLLSAGVAAAMLDPRGSRPVEQGTRAEKCAQKDWPFCTDDDWGPKCPSGCRMQGLMDKNDHSLLKRIEKIRNILEQNRLKHRSADQVSKQTYDFLKEKLIIEGGHDNSYYDLAQSLRQRINDMKIKIDRQLRILAALKDQVRDQVVDMQRLEVDIDIKLRSCKGSCSSYSEYQVDKDSYVELQKQVNQLDAQSAQTIETVSTLYVMKSRPLNDVAVDTIFKSGITGTAPQQQQTTEDMFPEVRQLRLVLEREGSSASPATISKDAGTSGTSFSSSSSSWSSTVSSSSSSKSITELGGGGGLFTGSFGDPSVTSFSTGISSTTCTKSIRRTVVDTKNGPVENVEEVIEGGPECQALAKGGASSTAFSTKTLFSGGTKDSLTTGSNTDLGNPFGDVGLDLGAFMTDDADVDLPDIHARSVKSARFERQADYVGTDCVDAHQKHLNGETNGLFRIKPDPAAPAVEVFCQQEGLMGGWLLAQQRESGELDFNRTWAEYRDGFGGVNARGRGEFWLGNRNLHLLTARGETMLRVELEDWEGGVATAEYTFSVDSEEEGFRLRASAYTGDAGDALAPQDGMKFSTAERDAATWAGSCNRVRGGGWWYDTCRCTNLNGFYFKGKPVADSPVDGVVWKTYKPESYSLKSARMFIRAAAF